MSDPVSNVDIYGRLLDVMAAGLADGGMEFITNYPGFHSNELFDLAGGKITSVDEKAAYAAAWGAAMAGMRSAVAFKNVGLNDAADAFLNSMLLGINAGLVVIVFDDIDVEHSQIRLDSRHYYNFYGGIWFEPCSVSHAYEIAADSFELSEKLGVPVVIRITNILYSRMGGATRTARRLQKPSFFRNPNSFVVHPSNAAFQEQELRSKRQAIEDYVESLYLSGASHEGDLVVVAGARHSGQNIDDYEKAFNMFTYPPPRRIVESWKGRKISVYEHGDNFLGNMLSLMIGGDDVRHFSLSNVRATHNYHNRNSSEMLFSAIRSVPGRIVCGDLGGYTMDPENTIDACLCYGASVAVAIGAAIASGGGRSRPVFCVTGDAAFIHSGKTCIEEAVERKLKLTVIVFDNGGSRGTGGQKIPGSLEVQGSGIQTLKAEYASFSPDAASRLLDKADAYDGVTLILMKTDF